jgi:hypothetical protein
MMSPEGCASSSVVSACFAAVGKSREIGLEYWKRTAKQSQGEGMSKVVKSSIQLPENRYPQKSATRTIPIPRRIEANHACAVICSARKRAEATATRSGLTLSNANNRFKSKTRIRWIQTKNQSDIEAMPAPNQLVRRILGPSICVSASAASFRQT